MFQVTQEQVDALEEWVENRREAYMRKGFHLAANAGSRLLMDFMVDGGLKAEDCEKSIKSLKEEFELAEMFHRDAKQLLYAGRQGG